MTTHHYHRDLDVLSAGTLAIIEPVAPLACGPRQPPIKQSVVGHRLYGTHILTTYYPRDENLHHGKFLFRHKGKRKKGKPNYPPTKMLVKTGRRWSKSQRGCRKLWKAEDRRWRPGGRMDPRQQRAVNRRNGKTQYLMSQLFTGTGPVGNVTAVSEPAVQERQS